ncbi:MAG: GGDEF domain-containing protein [Desulfobia sp.]
MFSFKNFDSTKKSLWFRSWQPFLSLPIYGKFIVVLISFIAGYILIGYASFYYTNHIKKGLLGFQNNYIEKHHTATRLQKSLRELQLQITVFTESSQPLDIRDQQALVLKIKDIRKILNRMEEDGISLKNSVTFQEIKKGFQTLSGRLQNNFLSTSVLGKSKILTPSQQKKITDDLTDLLDLTDDKINALIDKQQVSFKSLIDETDRHFINNALLVAALIIFLSTTSLLCVHLLVKFLQEMKEQFDALRTSDDDFSVVSGSDPIPVISQDEIGVVAESANELITYIKSLDQFRRIIEADESVREVYKRLAGIFKYHLQMDFFVLWEINEKEDTVHPVYIWPPELEEFICPLSSSSMCRAKRLNETVSSANYPGICPVFPESESMTHTCIPLTASGVTLGVAQFLFKYVDKAERTEHLRQCMYSARRYLREALPVLHAKTLAQNLHEMATKDTLTGLHNRRFLEDNLSTLTAGIKRRNSQLGILMCDIDYFKQVNDEYGHEAGDIVLAGLASILQNAIRESDMATRYGGEEFLVLLFECENEFPVKVAEKIRKTVESKQFRLGGNTIHKTLSIGVSIYPGDTENFWESVKYADVALYKAKEQGRNRVLRFTQDMWEDANY